MGSSYQLNYSQLSDDDEHALATTSDQDHAIAVRKSNTRLKEKSKSRLVSELDATSMTADDPGDTGVVVPKRPDARKRAVGSGLQSTYTPSLGSPALRQSKQVDPLNHDPEYLKNFRNSVLSMPKKVSLQCNGQTEQTPLNINKKLKDLVEDSSSFTVPTEVESQAMKQLHVRRGNNHGYISLDLDPDDSLVQPQARVGIEPRFVLENEDFVRDFEPVVEDGAFQLGKMVGYEDLEGRRLEMKDFFDGAHTILGENDSDYDRGTVYEAVQARAGMEGMHYGKLHSRSMTPSRVTPIPGLTIALARLRCLSHSMECSNQQLVQRFEELRNEKVEVFRREQEIKLLLNEAGDTYARVKTEVCIEPVCEDDSN
ncbi:hypothetical protein PRK78_003888 [Emydomyces testavorans]|uniref:Uncharacterized protein n=1 Tax=Emydomyces testavorans TaxID=2070801 RepID=A0AAF0II34_9EURO|nr:hypothetical protein PRK78_003888 [Emydomyces testavorans]